MKSLPPETRLHRYYKWAFGILSLVGLSLVVIATVKNGLVQSSVNTKLDRLQTSVDKLTVVPSNISQTPKLLTDQQVKYAIESVSPFRDTTAKVSVGCTISEVFSCQFANQWMSIFQKAGWNVNAPVLSQLYVPPSIAGVHISVAKQDTQGAGIIQQAFKSVGIDAQSELDSSLAPNEILIKFGLAR